MSTDLYYRKAEEKLTWIYSSRFARKQKLHKLALSASLKSLPKDSREGMSILAYTEYAKLLASDEDYHEAIKLLISFTKVVYYHTYKTNLQTMYATTH